MPLPSQARVKPFPLEHRDRAPLTLRWWQARVAGAGGQGSGCTVLRVRSVVKGGSGGRGVGELVAVAMLYVSRYLANELAGKGIKLMLKMS